MQSRYFHRRKLVQEWAELPGDEPEARRLDLQHRLVRQARGKLTFTPMSRPRAVLDVACGTGLWLREVGKAWRSTALYGFDIRESFMRHAERVTDDPQVTRRLRLLAANVLETFPYPDGLFDLTHARFIGPVVPFQQWSHVLREMVRVTRPGGWVENIEGELPHCDGPASTRLRAATMRLFLSRISHYDPAATLRQWQEEAGLVRVRFVTLRMGEGKLRHLRGLIEEDIVAAYKGMEPAFLATKTFSQEELTALLAALPDEIKQHGIMFPLHIAWGQKPQ